MPFNISVIFRSDFWLHKRFHYLLFILIGAIAGLTKLHPGSYNNYLIYKYTFIHLRQGLNLFGSYPEYFDGNHYGPLFPLIVAPFALIPDYAGAILWNIASAALLCYSLRTLPFTKKALAVIILLCANELFTASVSFQFNPFTAALLILSFSLVQKEKDMWAVLCVMIGTFVKLYGVVGLLFFFFSKHKPRYMMWCAIWAIVCFLAPLLVTDLSNLIKTYHDWYINLIAKNDLNTSLASFQDISVMGMARRFTQNATVPNLPFLIAGVFFTVLPLLRFGMYRELRFQLLMLASVMLFLVLFSTGSESPTYIIAFPGVVIWFMVQDRPIAKWVIGLLLFAIILTSLSPTDIFPRFIKDEYVRKYSLKALPCFFVWIGAIADLLFRNHAQVIWPVSKQ